MNVLYKERHTRIDTYQYEINGGGEFFIQESGRVIIVFENGKFVSASFPFQSVYTRNGWRILAGINDVITRIESEQALKGGK